MSDWDIFIKSVPWFLKNESKIQIGESRRGFNLTRDFINVFPTLSNLLDLAEVTQVSVDDSRYELLSWNSIDWERIGWLCQLSPNVSVDRICEDHCLLFTKFGGIIERFNEPEDTWLLNLNEALTLNETLRDGSLIEDYRWPFDDAGIDIPIQLTDYYSIAREANGNTTFCHRSTGNLILFAPDHSFDHISVLLDCPEYTLYTINGVTIFKDWVEEVARQWLNSIEGNA